MPRKYKNPPLFSVVCEFRFIPGRDWDSTIPGRIYSALENEYPNSRPAQALTQFGWVISPGPDAVQFAKPDDHSVVQVSADMISLFQRGGYPGWEQYLPEILKVFGYYRTVASPAGIQRIGLRYTNHINFDENNVKLSEWLNYSPHIPEIVNGVPSTMATFAMVSQYLHAENRDILTVQLASAGSNERGGARLILDIDYGLLQNSINFTDVEQWLIAAHATIESYFEAAILEPLRDRFGPIE